MKGDTGERDQPGGGTEPEREQRSQADAQYERPDAGRQLGKLQAVHAPPGDGAGTSGDTAGSNAGSAGATGDAAMPMRT